MEPVRAARAGKTDALLGFFDEHHAALFRFAYRLTGSAADAEDIVQDCFLGLLQPQCLYDPRRTPLRTYLFGAVRNQALKRLARREQTGKEGSIPADRRTPESQAFTSELADAVAGTVMQLPLPQREALVLAHYEQMPLAGIARVLDIEVGAVKSRLQRARATLREKLAAFAPGMEWKR